MLGSSDDWRIVGNHFRGGGNVELAGVGSVVTNNFGYNPVAVISDPWPSNTTDLTNDVVSGSSTPQSGVQYTVRHTPKTVVITGGEVSQLLINGTDAGSTAGTFKLGVGETIAITYSLLKVVRALQILDHLGPMAFPMIQNLMSQGSERTRFDH
jgi:hypothetical protein